MTRYLNIVTAKQFGIDVAESRIEGVEPMRRMGHNLNVGATWETVWCRSTLYSYLSAADNVDIVSDSAEDKVDGTGARSFLIKGLDANYALQSETIVPKGATPVASVNKYLRIFTVKAILPGSGGVNAGNITLADVTTSTTLAFMHAGEGKTLMALWTVPADKKVTILRWSYGEVDAKRTHVAMFVRPYGKCWYIGKIKMIKNQTSGSTLAMPIVFAEKTDIEIRAYSIGGSGAAQATMEGYYK